MKSYNNPLSLARAIGIKAGDIVSLVGGGGKTTTMFYLADELVKSGLKVIITTSTHIFPPDEGYTLLLTNDITEVEEAMKVNDLIVLADHHGKVKLEGIDPLWVKDLIKIADVILIEADGSRNLPFKAPEEHEPVISPASTIIIPLVGADAPYKPLSEDTAHRPHKIAEITGLKPGEIITPEVIAKTLLHPKGGMKDVPETARFIPLVNKADNREKVNIGLDISRHLFKGGVKKTVITSHRREKIFIKPCIPDGFVSAVILAAGGSSRMGRPKQELEIGGKTLANIVIKNVLASVADEIILVTQPGLPLVDKDIYPDIKRVVNENWKTGQSSSMKAGLEAADHESNAAMFFMADQPMVNAGIINRLIMTFYESDKPIVAPLYNGEKGSPVLFKRDLFGELKEIEGDKGGRDLLKKYPVEYVDIDLPLAGMDVDTPEEFSRLKEMISVHSKTGVFE
ncbi:MAG: selenium cofactor biosynthesis protein YqeC [Desulfobacteraceae bacterium]|jgi:molybdenum cofactor cytidylyltransferase